MAEMQLREGNNCTTCFDIGYWTPIHTARTNEVLPKNYLNLSYAKIQAIQNIHSNK